MDGIRIARKRVLRLMRENALLSPHRARRRDAKPHDRHIITEAPNIMWGTDATQITTVQDGKVWLCHGGPECLRPCQPQCRPRRGAATRPRQRVPRRPFHKQIRFWGMTPSYAVLGEPETNGVIERFFRTLKEQIVHGRIYQTIEDVRDAVRNFVARYNAEWLIEKNGLRSPSDARAAWNQAVMAAAA